MQPSFPPGTDPVTLSQSPKHPPSPGASSAAPVQPANLSPTPGAGSGAPTQPTNLPPTPGAGPGAPAQPTTQPSPPGDGLSKHHGQQFSTHDVDHDRVTTQWGGSCAKRFHGAWWYYSCYSSNLNGRYYRGGPGGVSPGSQGGGQEAGRRIEENVDGRSFDGVTWKPWHGSAYSLKRVVMKVIPRTAARELDHP